MPDMKICELDLSGKDLDKLPQSAVTTAKSMSESSRLRLNLSRNRLTSVACAPAFSLPQLEHLRLSHNLVGPVLLVPDLPQKSEGGQASEPPPQAEAETPAETPTETPAEKQAEVEAEAEVEASSQLARVVTPVLATTLISLDVSYNDLCGIRPLLAAFACLTSLKMLFLMGNPVCLNFQWPQRVTKAVPSLLYLDGRAITEETEETEEAQEGQEGQEVEGTAPQKLQSQPKRVDQPENLNESTLPNDLLSIRMMVGLEEIEWDKIADALRTDPTDDKLDSEEDKTGAEEEKIQPVLSAYICNLNEESKIQLTKIESSDKSNMVNDEQKPFEKLFEWSGEEAITVQLRNAIRDGIHLELCASFPGQEDGSSEKASPKMVASCVIPMASFLGGIESHCASSKDLLSPAPLFDGKTKIYLPLGDSEKRRARFSKSTMKIWLHEKYSSLLTNK